MLGSILLVCSAFGPGVVGFIMALTTLDKAEKTDYLKSCYQVKRIGIRWWFFSLLIFPLITTVSVLLDLLTGGTSQAMEILLALPIQYVLMIPIYTLMMLIFEELGWRGFALKPLLDRLGFTKASILLGIIWSVWHIPNYFTSVSSSGLPGYMLAKFGMFVLACVGISMIMSFVFTKTKYSILSAALLHGSYNLLGGLERSDIAEIVFLFLILSVGVGVCVYVGTAKKTCIRTLNSCYEVALSPFSNSCAF